MKSVVQNTFSSTSKSTSTSTSSSCQINILDTQLIGNATATNLFRGWLSNLVPKTKPKITRPVTTTTTTTTTTRLSTQGSAKDVPIIINNTIIQPLKKSVPNTRKQNNTNNNNNNNNAKSLVQLRTKVALIGGPCGSGKSTMIKAVATALGFQCIVIHMNVVRSVKNYEDIFNTQRQTPVVIVLEELHTLEAKEMAALCRLFDRRVPSHPTVCTYTESNSAKLREFRDRVLDVRFRSLSAADLIFCSNQIKTPQTMAEQKQIGICIAESEGDLRVFLKKAKECLGSEHNRPNRTALTAASSKEDDQTYDCIGDGTSIFATLRVLLTRRDLTIAQRIELWKAHGPRQMLSFLHYNWPVLHPEASDFFGILEEIHSMVWQHENEDQVFLTYCACITEYLRTVSMVEISSKIDKLEWYTPKKMAPNKNEAKKQQQVWNPDRSLMDELVKAKNKAAGVTNPKNQGTKRRATENDLQSVKGNGKRVLLLSRLQAKNNINKDLE